MILNKQSVGRDTTNIKKVIVAEGDSLRLNYSDFPNLRVLIVNSPDLKDLELDGKLRV